MGDWSGSPRTASSHSRSGLASIRQRLLEVHDAAVFLERDLPVLIERYLGEREARLASSSSSRILPAADLARQVTG